jgi:hypothetical protein
MIYILIETYPFEFSKVLGVFKNPEEADKAKQAAMLDDDSLGYNEFSVEPWEPV